MRTNTSHHSKKAFFQLGLIGMFFVSTIFTVVQGQEVTQNGTMYIGNNADFYISAGFTNFNFGASPATTGTYRTSPTYGKLIFGNGVGSTGASTDHFVDGYVKSLSTESFIFPVGQSGVYAPFQVTLISNNNDGIDVAYFKNGQVLGATRDASIAELSSKELWVVNSTASGKVSLSWSDYSDITTLANSDPTNLVIAGWNTATLQWDAILGSTTGTSSVGSITSNSIVDLTNYSTFTLGSTTITCLPLTASNGTTKTWNGSWSPVGDPTAENPVIINAAYHAGGFVCNTLELNADVTLDDGQVLEIVNGVSSSTGKKIIMSSSSSVVQRNAAAAAPTINLIKQTRLLKLGDYTYFGTPIAGNFSAQLLNAKAVTGSKTGAIDGLYWWDTSRPLQPANNFSYWYPLTSTTSGKGFVGKIKNQAPFLNNYNITDNINIPLNGMANNGDISVPIYKPNSIEPDDEGNYNLLGNPYPSAIDVDKFLTENRDIDGVVYIWSAKTQNEDTGRSYSQADFIAYTKLGTTYNGSTPLTFDGKIASGQGFMVKALVNNSTVIFTNCMRLSTTSSNSSFLRTAQKSKSSSSNQIDKFKLNMTNNKDVFSQILIGYLPNGTLAYDRLYDASRNSVSSAQLYSILDTDGTALAINARPTFTETDIVPLGISKSDTTDESFTISIDEKEGVFNDNTISIFLHDKSLGKYHNLADGGYTFSTNETSSENRFEVVYQNKTLSNPDFSTNEIIANIDTSLLTIKTYNEMKLIEVYDISGRKIQTIKAENAKSVSKAFNYAKGVYIAKIEFENGAITSHKLINK